MVGAWFGHALHMCWPCVWPWAGHVFVMCWTFVGTCLKCVGHVRGISGVYSGYVCGMFGVCLLGQVRTQHTTQQTKAHASPWREATPGGPGGLRWDLGGRYAFLYIYIYIYVALVWAMQMSLVCGPLKLGTYMGHTHTWVLNIQFVLVVCISSPYSSYL